MGTVFTANNHGTRKVTQMCWLSYID